MNLEEAIKELFYWQVGWFAGEPRDNFHAKLYDLIHKSDVQNKARLRQGFPEEVEAWEMWAGAPSAEKFFADHGHKMTPNFDTPARKNGDKR